MNCQKDCCNSKDKIDESLLSIDEKNNVKCIIFHYRDQNVFINEMAKYIDLLNKKFSTHYRIPGLMLHQKLRYNKHFMDILETVTSKYSINSKKYCNSYVGKKDMYYEIRNIPKHIYLSELYEVKRDYQGEECYWYKYYETLKIDYETLYINQSKHLQKAVEILTTIIHDDKNYDRQLLKTLMTEENNIEILETKFIKLHLSHLPEDVVEIIFEFIDKPMLTFKNFQP